MKNGFLVVVGLLVSLAVSWGFLAYTAHLQLGALAPYYDQMESRSFPERMPGLAARGKRVYDDLGCVACHTQAVRRADYGSDIERKWGKRQSYARDYIHQDAPALGMLRVGPDLANVGDRLTGSADIYRLLYSGTPNMPGYPFLFDERPAGVEPSGEAVAVVDGRQLVPTERARALAAYLMGLKGGFNYPDETTQNTVKEPAGHGAPKHEAAPPSGGEKK